MSHRASNVVFVGIVAAAFRPFIVACTSHGAFCVVGEHFGDYISSENSFGGYDFDFLKFDSGASTILFDWAAALHHLNTRWTVGVRTTFASDRNNDWS